MPVPFASLYELEDQNKHMSHDQRDELHKFSRKFRQFDVSILYVITICLIIDVFVLTSYIDKRSIILGQELFMISAAVVFALVRIWNFKYNLLHPVISLWGDHVGNFCGKAMFALAIFCGFGGVSMMMATVFEIAVYDFNASLGLTVGTCCMFIITSLMYRLHVGSFVKRVVDKFEPPAASVPVPVDVAVAVPIPDLEAGTGLGIHQAPAPAPAPVVAALRTLPPAPTAASPPVPVVARPPPPMPAPAPALAPAPQPLSPSVRRDSPPSPTALRTHATADSDHELELDNN